MDRISARNNQILVVDDEPLVCKSLGEVLNRSGYKAQTAANGYEALEAIRQSQFSVIITDMSMPRMDGLEVLQRAKAIIPDVAVIIITGYGTVNSAVEAMRCDADDYIMKPFSPDRIRSTVEKLIIGLPSAGLEHRCATDPGLGSTDQEIITADPQMLDILDRVTLMAQADSTVLIQGESGTGKELVARAIHRSSRRAGKPYVAVNCAALPEGLVESELFGHEKGAFTGAIANRIGKLEQADGGTILLDEIGEMPRPFQAKLLRAIQEREVVRIGGTLSIKVDVRIIATTNKKLVEEVDKGNFREDLFYRIYVVPIFLPPLRERRTDIPLLARYFSGRICARMGKDVKEMSPEVMEALEEYSWPGNVRELKNTMERVIALARGAPVSPNDLFINARSRPPRYISLRIGTSLQEAERELIIRTLEEVGGSKQKTAEILGITSKTIRNKLNQYKHRELQEPEDAMAP